ncbi:hypothetical protein [Xanthomonas campestris]|uniref:hypothetical protein n=1 Tax=Xanthomonas campestris TaxID=339 RepID=UPI0023EA2960|nr:hypothetical protein [Xanthomonas campestris]
MNPLESAVLKFIKAAYPAYASILESQFQRLLVEARNFTDGGGVFVFLRVTPDAVAFPALWVENFGALEGPALTSPELESGATATLHVNPAGFISSIEIWAHANDYPIDRHPSVVSLSPNSGNVVDLRSGHSAGGI